MSIGSLRGLPAFLRALALPADPATAVAALVSGPFAGLGVRTCRMWALEEDALVSIASRGHTAEENARYAVLPAHLDLSMWDAVRSGTPVITQAQDRLDTRFASVDRQFWTGVLRRTEAASVIRGPLVLGDVSVGAIGVIVAKPWPDDAADLLTTVCSALALWMGTAETLVAAARAATRSDADPHLEFTDRQRQILRLVSIGQSNPSIAAALGISASTVKTDLAAAMRALRADSREAAAETARDLGLS